LPAANMGTLLGRILSAMALLDRGTESVAQDEVAFWAGHLVRNEAHPFAPVCDMGGDTGRSWPVTVTFETGLSFTPFTFVAWPTINSMVWSRAALMLHETRHAQGMIHLL